MYIWHKLSILIASFIKLFVCPSTDKGIDSDLSRLFTIIPCSLSWIFLT
jgi:hypothetical protein